jgi:AcrR family transcriptional regulator
MSKAMDKENVSDDTRKRIIDAALRLFGQVGYIKASTRAIAEAAGVNEVTLFRHFGSKKNLLMACMQAFNETSFPEVFESNLTGDFAADTMCMALQQIEDTRVISRGRSTPEWCGRVYRQKLWRSPSTACSPPACYSKTCFRRRSPHS